MVLDLQAVGPGHISQHKIKANFWTFISSLLPRIRLRETGPLRGVYLPLRSYGPEFV